MSERYSIATSDGFHYDFFILQPDGARLQAAQRCGCNDEDFSNVLPILEAIRSLSELAYDRALELHPERLERIDEDAYDALSPEDYQNLMDQEFEEDLKDAAAGHYAALDAEVLSRIAQLGFVLFTDDENDVPEKRRLSIPMFKIQR